MYYLYRISNQMEWLNDKGLPMYNHESIKEIKRDIQRFKPITQCGVQFKNDVKNEIGMDVSIDHNQSYYISDFADRYRYRYIKFFLTELKPFLVTVKSEILRDIISAIIQSYESEEWLLLHYSKDDLK